MYYPAYDCDLRALIDADEKASVPAFADNLKLDPILGTNRDELIRTILTVINDPNLPRAGEKDRWDKVWPEVLERYETEGEAALIPPYFRKAQPLRVNGVFVFASDPNIEYEFYRRLTRWVFSKYFSDVSSVYEFGCGSCINLANMRKWFPNHRLTGLDWVSASTRIAERLGICGGYFNFFDGGWSMPLGKDVGVLTVGAMEQTGDRWRPFIDYLLKSHPAICVHIEPVLELYDEHSLFDYLAVLYHRARGYWEGFIPFLKELETKGRAEILRLKRCRFGSTYLEGYSQIVWRPT